MEFPHLQKLVEKYGSKNFVVVTINNDVDDEATGVLKMTRQKFGFLNLQAPDGQWIGKTYKVQGFPTTCLLDADGKAVFTHVGYSPDCEQVMGAQIEALLARANKNK